MPDLDKLNEAVIEGDWKTAAAVTAGRHRRRVGAAHHRDRIPGARHG